MYNTVIRPTDWGGRANTALLAGVAIVIWATISLAGWRILENQRSAQVVERLLQAPLHRHAAYSPELVADQPEPVRRFFNHAIAPGTPLHMVVELKLEGDLDMGSKDARHPRMMTARQVINFPWGYVWQVELQGDEMRLVGSDGAYRGDSWSRFWFMGLIPVAGAGGTVDHYRSSFGRYAAEAVLWSPASVLPGVYARWSAPGEDLARVELSYMGESVVVDITLDQQGAPVQIAFDRWTDANDDKEFRMQRFGAYVSKPQSFDGFTLPTRVIAGNHFGTDAYFPFYEATVTSAQFGEP